MYISYNIHYILCPIIYIIYYILILYPIKCVCVYPCFLKKRFILGDMIIHVAGMNLGKGSVLMRAGAHI